MKSPKDQRTIQIDITNACPHKCSNCTRFCGHHKKNFFMDFETFKRAVDSLEGFQGTIGMMGGEPTLHPEFERFARYLDSKTDPKEREQVNNFIKPQKDFMRFMHNREFESVSIIPTECEPGTKITIRGPGLWSTMGTKYREHYELIQDMFRMQSLNDHGNIMYHSPILVSRKEMCVPDEEWVKLRDNCWIQNCWSSTITPKGAFFCEVAGALDMLFDGPGGWPVEPGWWKRKPEEFGEQLQWCEICGMALDLFTRDANEEVDDVSPEIYKKLIEIGSPKALKGKVNVLKIEDGKIAKESQESIWGIHKARYWESYESRMSTQSVLYPQGFEGIVIYDSSISYDENVANIRINAEQLDTLAIIADGVDTAKKLKKDFVKDTIITWIGDSDKKDSFGRCLNRVFSKLDSEKERFLLSGSVVLRSGFADEMRKMVLNPGTMHYLDFSKNNGKENAYVENADRLHSGYIGMFSACAYALKRAGFSIIAKIETVEEFVALWDEKKVISLSRDMEYDCPDNVIEKGKSYVLYGTGRKGRRTAGIMREKEAIIYAYCDSNEEKWGIEQDGHIIISPEQLIEKRAEYDKVIIASNFYNEIREKLYSLGFKDCDIVLTE